MTNIMNSQIVEGFQQRTASVMKKCEASLGNCIDIYVCSTLLPKGRLY